MRSPSTRTPPCATSLSASEVLATRPACGLHLPALQQVELLIGAAELDIGFENDRFVALHDRTD
jgi:hypothetical protein